MKKMIALGMAAIMCLSMTACSVSTSSKTETTAAATKAAETTAEAASTKGASDEAVLHIGSLKTARQPQRLPAILLRPQIIRQNRSQ